MTNFGSILFIGVLYVTKVSSFGEFCMSDCLANTNFTENVENVGYCARGCRLMQLIDSANSDNGNLEALLQVCHQSCVAAYDDTDLSATSACQYGCTAQLSAVIDRREQLAMWYQEAMEYAEMLHWASSFMSCFQSENDAQEPKGNVYVRTRLVIISSAGNDDNDYESAIVGSPMFSGDESKWGIRGFSHRVGLPPRSVVIVFGLMFVILFYLTVALCCPGCCRSKADYTHTQKLSIYGDGEHLKTLDEADEELLMMEKKPIEEPRVLLMKIPIHSV